jgi:putative oxidoreductase
MLASAQRFQPYALALLRIFTALSFISHGTQKLLAFPAAPSWGMPGAFSLPWIAGVLEIGGGALVLVGFLTRPTAFLLSGLMAVAYWMAHGSKGFYPILNGGEAAMLFCFIFLYIFAAGPGALSVDGLRRRG